jgi:hypothetical protein
MFKSVLGVWDLNKAPLTLGGLLTFAEELKIQCLINKLKVASLCFYGDLKHIKKICNVNMGKKNILSKNMCKKSVLLSTIFEIEGIDSFYFVNEYNELMKFVKANYCLVWPGFSKHGIKKHRYESTLFVQDFYRKYKYIPVLSCKRTHLNWAKKFLMKNLASDAPIAVHLKNKPKEHNCSNANLYEWEDFFKVCYGKYNVKFILIGNETINTAIRKLPNIIVAGDHGSNLIRDLAIIQTSDAFMGMASGPCNMAIFNKKPYLIYKNPSHHSKAMKEELGDKDKFNFATSRQRIFREYETKNNLLAEFERIFNNRISYLKRGDRK